MLLSDNIDLLHIRGIGLPLEFLSTMYSYGYIPQILQSTRVAGMSATLIIHIYINDTSVVLRAGIIRSSVSDHFPVFVAIAESFSLEAVNNVVTTKRRVIKDTTKQQFSKMISIIDWSNIAGIESVDDMYESFIELVSSKLDYCFPLVSRKKKMLDLQKKIAFHQILNLSYVRNIAYRDST